MNKVLVIAGATSTGKTSLALQKAKEMKDVLVISADSRQIYKYFDIGTNKLPLNSNYKISKHDGYWTFDDITIHGYDITTPDKTFSVFDYLTYVNKLITTKKPKNVIIVGGSGFYINALVGESTLQNFPPNPELRDQLQNKSLLELQNTLTSLNIQMPNYSESQNKQRIIRTIEKYYDTKNHKKITESALKNYQKSYTYLSLPRKELYAKVDGWIDTIWRDLAVETTNLLNSKYKNCKLLKGIIYKSVVSAIQGEKEMDCIQRAKFDLHAYIRRQETWFKKHKYQ